MTVDQDARPRKLSEAFQHIPAQTVGQALGNRAAMTAFSTYADLVRESFARSLAENPALKAHIGRQTRMFTLAISANPEWANLGGKMRAMAASLPAPPTPSPEIMQYLAEHMLPTIEKSGLAEMLAQLDITAASEVGDDADVEPVSSRRNIDQDQLMWTFLTVYAFADLLFEQSLERMLGSAGVAALLTLVILMQQRLPRD